MSFLNLTLVKDGSITHKPEQVRAFDTENIKLALPCDIEERFPIVDVNATLNTFTISGDHTSLFLNGSTFTIEGSTANDGSYTVTGDSTYDGTNTVITVTTDITDFTDDGEIVSSTDGACLWYYNNQRKSIDEYLVEESPDDILLSAESLTEVKIISYDNNIINKTGLLQTHDSMVYMKSLDYAIVAVDIANDEFEIKGNLAKFFKKDNTIIVLDSTANDATYTIENDASYDRDTNRTIIPVTANLTDATADGTLTLGTEIHYNMGERNHARHALIIVNETVEQINVSEADEICYKIIDVSPTLQSFTIEGNHSFEFTDNNSFEVKGSTGNNGTYTVNANSIFDGSNTIIIVDQAIPNTTADGRICIPVS